MGIVTVGIDLAKNVFALHGVDQSGKAVFIKPKVVRGQLLEMVAVLEHACHRVSGLVQLEVDDRTVVYSGELSNKLEYRTDWNVHGARHCAVHVFIHLAGVPPNLTISA